MDLFDLKNDWQKKYDNAQDQKQKLIAEKRLAKINEQIEKQAIEQFKNMSKKEMIENYDKIYVELEKVRELYERFDDESLLGDIESLRKQLRFIEQKIAPDDVVKFTSKLGEIIWNKSKHIISVAGMQFTEAEIKLIRQDMKTIDNMSELEKCIKRDFHAQYIGRGKYEEDNFKKVPDYLEYKRRRYAKF